MGRKRAEIDITLKSDLCVGSGYSYAGVIDTDICYNENGIPYIPAKRLKGCLRESAELIKINNTDEIFGSGGNSSSGRISIANAYPKEFEKLNEEIEFLKDENSEYKQIISTQKVLEQFSYVKAQTAIDTDTGVSKNNSLRYIRAVKQYSPIDEEELHFYAEIIYYDENENDIERMVKALRNIGMNRSRGLGSVKCNLIGKEDIKDEKLQERGSEDKQVCLEYTIKNISPLMLSGNFDDRTENYVKGQMIMGAIAARYLLQEGKSDRDELFYDLFMSGKVKYSNLHISKKHFDGDKEVIKKYVPAPLFINSLKKSKKIVNLTRETEKHTFGEGADYYSGNGNQPKKLKNKCVCISDDKKSIFVAEPEKDIVYHHSKRAKFSKNIDRDDNESGLLYSMEVIRENQYFSGSITGEKKYIDIISQLLDTLRLGKSKTTQYGICNVEEMKISDHSVDIRNRKDEKILVVLESNGIFINGKKGGIFATGDTGYTVRCEKIAEIIADDLGIDAELINEYTFLQAENVTGYNTAWNLKKHSLPTISAGSVIAYKLNKDATINKEFVGEKNTEGFGKICIYKFDELPVTFKEEKIVKKTIKSDISKRLMENIIFDDFMGAAKLNSLKTRNIGINSATLGRLTLMLKESMRVSKEYNVIFEDFKKRIDSIKRNSERKEIVIFLTDCLGYDKEFGMIEEAKAENLQINTDKLIGSDEAKGLYEKMKTLGIENIEEKIKGKWCEYLSYILTYQRRRVENK